MGIYDPLRRFLSERDGPTLTLTFSAIENIICKPLPLGARKRKSWWENDKTHTQARSWLDEDWKVGWFCLETEQVRFVRSGRSLEEPLTARAPSQVIVRNLDADVVARLKRRAKREGRSLEGELRIILTRAARPQRADLIAETDRIRAMTAGPLEDSVSLLRIDRDGR